LCRLENNVKRGRSITFDEDARRKLNHAADYWESSYYFAVANVKIAVETFGGCVADKTIFPVSVPLTEKTMNDHSTSH
jgi:hypothetical protein